MFQPDEIAASETAAGAAVVSQEGWGAPSPRRGASGEAVTASCHTPAAEVPSPSIGLTRLSALGRLAASVSRWLNG